MEGGGDSREIEVLESVFGGVKELDFRTEWLPDLGAGGAPKGEGGKSERGGKVGDAGVVTDEVLGLSEQTGEVRQRKILGETDFASGI